MKTMHGNPNRAGFSPWRMLMLCLLALVVAVSAAPGAKAQADILDLDNMTFGWAFGLDNWTVTFTSFSATDGVMDIERNGAAIATSAYFDVSTTAFSATYSDTSLSEDLWIYIGTSGSNTITASSTAAYALVFLMEGGDVYYGTTAIGARDEVYGGGGDDFIYTFGGDDAVMGDDWSQLTSTPGDDYVFLGAGNDLGFDEVGYNYFEGGADNDTLTVGGDSSQTCAIWGGSGDDELTGFGAVC